MTIYEQIEKSVDCVERMLNQGAEIRGKNAVTEEAAAAEAAMSIRSFASWFQAVTGISFREYVLRRRLERARREMETGDERILDIALGAGYRSHEAFSRAFRAEFGLTPSAYRAGKPAPRGLERIELIKEMYMGVIVKELGDMLAVYFDGFAPSSEDKAHSALDEWAAAHPAGEKKRRIFGHNIDRNGALSCNPQNEGYRLLAVVDSPGEAAGAKTATIKGGKFLVTGIEGNFKDDPEGKWITRGWERMNAMIRDKNLKPAPEPRWFEEELEPSVPGNLRLDLYLEVGE